MVQKHPVFATTILISSNEGCLLIRLPPSLVPCARSAWSSREGARARSRGGGRHAGGGVHPARRYLQELRSAYSDFALFFHDTYGGDVIAVLWRPDIDEPKEFQVSTANALKPVTEGSQVQYRVNKQALAADFALLGQGLVKEVIVT
ncbi:unnamed protein product [Plutella xylostella]|uniref:Nucleolar protein 6 n=1 Tax=Plutella xylostella TaxID=51655 RepID=A0A8S4EL84_PLUXY|nr:unnamed protein product [Plutella xylostella]